MPPIFVRHSPKAPHLGRRVGPGVGRRYGGGFTITKAADLDEALEREKRLA
ncbi:hypothetical protein [Sinosporangium album]|uniref:hypothetical protein n=1 Tax=Sinosporangium album TaxID=504805 RepID=UPI0015A008FD|nr:hypothetical protein [Sinosporangium album]